jgi:hypothetical protein
MIIINKNNQITRNKSNQHFYIIKLSSHKNVNPHKLKNIANKTQKKKNMKGLTMAVVVLFLFSYYVNPT